MEQRSHFGMTPLPTLEPRQCIRFALCSANFDQRMFLSPALTGRPDPLRLAGVLAVVRRPWCVPQTVTFVSRGKL